MRRHKSKKFWDREYEAKKHFTLSENPGEDLLKFLRWFEREYGHPLLNYKSSVLDLGCGNGRNLIYLAQTYGSHGIGIDSSAEAVKHARLVSKELPVKYFVLSIAHPLPIQDASQTLVLDMMTSHSLKKEDREHLRKESARVLKYDGWLFLKTFLRDEDRHAERLLKEYPANEEGSYIHPQIGLAEHVFKGDELSKELEAFFAIQKIKKSHGHLSRGHARKRRSMSVYAKKRE